MAIFPSQPFGALIFTLYSLSRSILALHLLVRQVPISVHVPSAVPPYFLLVAMIEVTLSRSLFSLTWSGRWWVHLMRRRCIYSKPALHRTPTWVPFYSHFLRGAFLGAAFIETLLFPLKFWSAEDRVVLGCPLDTSALPYLSSVHPPRHGPEP